MNSTSTKLEYNIVDVTIILNIWKRTYFAEQISALLSQTVLPKEIWVIQYENIVEIQSEINKYKKYFPSIYHFKIDKNLVFFGRYSIAINANSKFVWVLDDDIIPGVKWLEKCVEKCESLNSIISCTGRIIPKNDFRPEEFNLENLEKNFIGDFSKEWNELNICSEDTIVDYCCNSYFFKKEWISAFWSVWPVTFSLGDDIHLSATCNYKLNIKTVVLKQTNESNSGCIRKHYGRDDFSSWRDLDFINQREDVLKYHILDNNWIPLLW